DLKARISQGMRGINVAVAKVHCAGGMISVGDWVDVQLVTNLEEPAAPGNGKNAPPPSTASAVIARAVRVIAKRNSLWPVMTPLAPDMPYNFTLEANPYRAGLIEFVKDKGTIALLPLSD